MSCEVCHVMLRYDMLYCDVQCCDVHGCCDLCKTSDAWHTLYVCIMCLYVCFSYCVRCVSHVFQNVMCVKCDTSVVMDFRKFRTASFFGHENFKATKVAASTES